MCEKINKNERKNKAEILTEAMGAESVEFWTALGEPDGDKPENPPQVTIDFNWGSLSSAWMFLGARRRQFCTSTAEVVPSTTGNGLLRVATSWGAPWKIGQHFAQQ